MLGQKAVSFFEHTPAHHRLHDFAVGALPEASGHLPPTFRLAPGSVSTSLPIFGGMLVRALLRTLMNPISVSAPISGGMAPFSPFSGNSRPVTLPASFVSTLCQSFNGRSESQPSWLSQSEPPVAFMEGHERGPVGDPRAGGKHGRRRSGRWGRLGRWRDEPAGNVRRARGQNDKQREGEDTSGHGETPFWSARNGPARVPGRYQLHATVSRAGVPAYSTGAPGATRYPLDGLLYSRSDPPGPPHGIGERERRRPPLGRAQDYATFRPL